MFKLRSARVHRSCHMDPFITITCLHCQEDFECQMDSDESSEFTVDCEIDYQSITVKASCMVNSRIFRYPSVEGWGRSEWKN